MDFIYCAVFFHVLFNAKKSAESSDEDIIAMTGCNISLTWMLPITAKDLAFNIGSSYERPIATHAVNNTCDVRDNSLMLCNINSTDNRRTVVLNIFNVTARQNGNYTIWIKTITPEQYSNVSKTLVVIGKPKILEVQKPILGMSFQMTCNTANEPEHFVYWWRINDIERTTVYNVNSYNISILDMNDNFSNVTCQVCFNENASNLSSVTCENDGCSKDSDPYTIQVLYGPDNVSLSRGERYFYLKENDIFAIDCFAKCYPDCIFVWKGRDTIQSHKLTIVFESRMDGQYVCHVTNQQTNITLLSDPITLHLAKEDQKVPNEKMKVFLSIGLVGVAVLLVVIGVLLVRPRRKNSSDKIDSQVLTELLVNLQTLTNVEISQGISRIRNRPLAVSNTLAMSSRRRYRPHYLNQNRISRSLHNLMDSTQDSFNPLRGGLSLQGLYSSSNTLDWSLMNGTQPNGPINRRHLSNSEANQLDDMNSHENVNNVKFMYARDRKDRETKRDEHSAEEESETLNNLQHITFEEEPQENPYNTIDEEVVSLYDDARDDITNETSNEAQIYNIDSDSDNIYTDSHSFQYNN